MRTASVLVITLAVVAGASVAASANSKYAGLVIDAKTGNVLYESHADASRYPASLTKMMTLYLTFEALATGRVSKNTQIPISRNAAAEVPSKIGLKPGSTIGVEDAIHVLVTKSANDVATAMGEFLGGSEAEFARMMTRKARQLGMSSTTFKNAHGLPNSAQKTTARDMARLGLALREHHPGYYHYFSTRSYAYKGNRYPNHNRLLGQVEGVDGIKTGYIRASGFNLVTSVRRGDRSIVAVVMGGRTGRSRDAHMIDLIGRYLHKASAGADQELIARGSDSGPIMFPGNRVPLPTDRPDMETMTAYANEAPVATGSTPLIAEEQPSKAFDVVEKVAEPAEGVDALQTNSTSRPEGWVIQVGSLPSEDAARAFLDRTTSKASTLLADASAFTETFVKDGKTYHRARYGGFAGKSEAWNACASLKKKDVACYAVER